MQFEIFYKVGLRLLADWADWPNPFSNFLYSGEG